MKDLAIASTLAICILFIGIAFGYTYGYDYRDSFIRMELAPCM